MKIKSVYNLDKFHPILALSSKAGTDLVLSIGIGRKKGLF